METELPVYNKLPISKVLTTVLGLSIAAIGMRFLQNYVLLNEQIYFNHFQERLSISNIEKILEDKNDLEWYVYGFLLIKKLFGLAIAALSVYAGIHLFAIVPTTYRSVLLIVAKCDSIFLFVPIFNVLWFSFIDKNYTLQDLQFFYPLSIISLFNPTELDPWFVYPTQLLNLFEVLYWVVLAYQLKPVLNEDFSGSLGFVGRTYGVGLVIWVILVMFLTVSIS